MNIKRFKELYNSSTAATSDWYQLDTRYDENMVRSLVVSVTSGDTVTIEGIVKDVKGGDKSFLDVLVDGEIATIKAYTESGRDVLEGPWTYIRVVKEGSNGRAIVQGFV